MRPFHGCQRLPRHAPRNTIMTASGQYVFRVTAANQDGVWNEAGRALTVIVTPAWWQTWWFRALALALIASSVIGAFAWRVSNLKGQQRVLEAEIAERKQVETQLRRSHAQIEDLAGRLITAQEEERRRIARDLHDDVNQQLAALSIALSDVKRRVTGAADGVRERLTSLQQRTLALADLNGS